MDIKYISRYYLSKYWKLGVLNLVVFVVLSIVLTLMEKTYTLYSSYIYIMPTKEERETEKLLPYLYTFQTEDKQVGNLLAEIVNLGTLEEFARTYGYRAVVLDKEPRKLVVRSLKVMLPDTLNHTITLRTPVRTDTLLVETYPKGKLRIHVLSSKDAALHLRRSMNVDVVSVEDLFGIKKTPQISEGQKILVMKFVMDEPFVQNVVEDFADFLIKHNLRSKTKKYQKSKSFINQQIENYTKELNEINYRINILKLSPDKTYIDENHPIWKEFVSLLGEKLEIQSEMEAIRRWLSGKSEIGELVVRDEDLNSYRKLILSMKDSLLSLSIMYGTNHPRYTFLKSKLDSLSQLFKEKVVSYLKNLEARIRYISIKESKLKRMVGRSLENEKDILTLTARKRAIEDIITLLTQRIEEIRIEESQVVPDFKIVEISPEPSAIKVGRDWLRNVLASLVLSLLFTFMLALIQEYTSTTLKSEDEIKILVNVSNIHSIPYIDRKEDMPISILMSGDLRKILQGLISVESFRMLAFDTTVNRRSKVIGITSSTQGEGKTFVSINLSAVVSMMRKKTVVMDTDLRKKDLTKFFGLQHEKGLLDMENAENPKDLVINIKDQLFVVPAGISQVDPIAILGSEKFQNFVAWLKERYDMIILDMPPVLNISETMIMAKLPDYTCVVARADYTPTKALKRTMEILKERVSCIVLNGISMQGLYYRYYRYYRYKEQS